MTEDRITPHSALTLGYIVGALHGVKEPIFIVADILTENGEIILESKVGGPQIRVTIREMSESER